MAATLPITGSPLEVSTDPVDVGDGNGPGHVQRMKILDGTNEGTTPLAVDANGALREPCSILSFAAVPTVAEAGGYTLGQAVGEVVDLGVAPFAGVTRHLVVIVGSVAGGPLPDLDVFVIQTPAAVTVGDFPYGDGDTFAPPGALTPFALGAVAADFAPMAANPNLVRWSVADTLQVHPGDGSAPRWFLSVRAGETFADDLSAGLVVYGFVEVVRSVPLELAP